MSSNDRASAQTWSPESYDRHARFVSDLAGEILAWLDPKPGERILDLGCGDGVLTARLRDLGCDVIGVDSGADMIAAARALGLDARLIDGHELPFRDEFGAVFSNAALHWMVKPRLALAGVWQALKSQGRFVADVTAMRAMALKRGGDADLAGKRLSMRRRRSSGLACAMQRTAGLPTMCVCAWRP